jgi:transglutaminase-like putative cysteine protease
VARFKVVHETRYDYVDHVTACHNETHLTPRQTDRQRLLSHIIEIEPRPDGVAERVDFFGNTVRYFAIERLHDALAVVATSEVAVAPVDAQLGLSATASWEVAAKRTATELDDVTLEARQYALDSPLVSATPAMTEYASPSFPPGRPTVEAVLDLTHRIHADFAFDAGFTTLATPVLEVLAHRRGVCQDFAHLAIAALRGHGLAARYVSGYLETTPPDGADRLVGVDASHAWVSVFVPDLGWLDLDPTNDLVPSDRHITTAWGRDYSDVTPLKGVIYTSATEQDLTVSVDVVRLD